MVNAKPYVGQTTEKIPQKRWNKHVPGSVGPYLLNAYAKYGRENFSYSILCECPDEKLNEYEQSYVKLYSSMCPSLGGIGYNLTLGGLAGGKLSEETKQKIGDAQRGVPKSEESKKKLSETRKAMNWTPSPEHKEKLLYASINRVRTQEERDKISAAHKGKTISEEQKQKLRELHTGLKATEEAKKNMSIAQTGRTHSDETRQKISESNKGRAKTQEHKDKIGLLKSKKVDQFTLEGIFIKTHSSARAAASETNTHASSIGQCCAGKQKTSGGYIWKFSVCIVNDETPSKGC
jgi:group I intron endonuclease